MHPTEARRRVARARVARLATVAPDGRPHAVPICFVLDGDTVYSAVDRKPKRTTALQRLTNVRAHPDAALIVDQYDDDWTALWWVRLRGPARVLDDGDEREHALALLRQKYPQYREQPPDGPVLAIDVDEWQSWAASAGAVLGQDDLGQ